MRKINSKGKSVNLVSKSFSEGEMQQVNISISAHTTWQLNTTAARQNHTVYSASSTSGLHCSGLRSLQGQNTVIPHHLTTISPRVRHVDSISVREAKTHPNYSCFLFFLKETILNLLALLLNLRQYCLCNKCTV